MTSLRALMDDMLESIAARRRASARPPCRWACAKRIIVMDLARADEPPQPRHFVNPEITWASEEMAVREEGCLSVPDIYDEVERPARAIGAEVPELPGRGGGRGRRGPAVPVCIQHEMDHLRSGVRISSITCRA